MDLSENADDFFDLESTEPQQKRARRNKVDKFDKLIETITDISNKKINTFLKLNGDIPPELSDFFASIGRTVAKFNPYEQAVIKKKNSRCCD